MQKFLPNFEPAEPELDMHPRMVEHIQGFIDGNCHFISEREVENIATGIIAALLSRVEATQQERVEQLLVPVYRAYCRYLAQLRYADSDTERLEG